MEIYLDKWQDGQKKVLDNEQLDVIADAVESLLFTGEFFASPWNMVTINTIFGQENEDKRVLFCRGDKPLDLEAHDALNAILSDQVSTVFAAVEDSEGAVQFGRISGVIPGAGVCIASGVMKLEDEYVILFVSAENREQFEIACNGFCGLVHTIYQLMAPRHQMLDLSLVPPITVEHMVDSMTNSAIAKRVTSWFASGRESVKAWRAKTPH